MYFRALAADYDGTLALHGAVDERTIRALQRLRQAGRRIILVTGREMQELRHVMPDLTLFDRVVAENGGVLYDPAAGLEQALGPGPPPALVQTLMERGVEPLSVGRTVLATWQPHGPAVLSAIAELGLDHQIILNKGAVMVLPAGVNKATGLAAALRQLGLSAINVVAVGDAENDLAFLSTSGCSAAVANALPSVKAACDLVMAKDHGAGIVELVERMLRDDAALVPRERRGVSLGIDIAGEPAWLTPQESLLIAGGSGSGKSRFASLLTERMLDQGFAVCILDSEGEYETLEGAVAIGDETRPGSVVEAVRLIAQGINVVLGTVAIDLDARRRLFERLVPRLLALRKSRGRPHWLVVDEAHHYLPSGMASTDGAIARGQGGLVLATVDPDWLARPVVDAVDHVLAFGSAAEDVLARCAGASIAPRADVPTLGPDQALLWSRATPEALRILRIAAPRRAHRRHQGKYAVGDVGEAHSFYFAWSPDGRLHRACNLTEFIAKAASVPDVVWKRHLRAGDFAAWFLHVIRDEELCRLAREVAHDRGISARDGRHRIEAAIRARYAIPGSGEG